MRVVAYVTDGMVDVDPAISDYRYEFSDKDVTEAPVPWWRERGQALYAGPSVGHIRALNNRNLDEVMKLGFDGFYLDGYMYVSPSINPLNDAYTVDPWSGKRQATFGFFARREQMKDMARILAAYRPEGNGIIDGHASAGYPSITMSHVTDATNGEGLAWFGPTWPEHITPDTFRAEYSGRPLGFNADALFYPDKPMPTEWAISLTGLHGTLPRMPQWGILPPRAKGIWDLADRFDTTGARFVAYFDPEAATFKPVDDRVKASAFVHPDGRVLLQVVNWSDDDNVPGDVQLDLKALGLQPQVTARLLNTNQPLLIDSQTLKLTPLKPRRMQYIWLGQGL